MAPATFQLDDGTSLQCAPSVVAVPAILSCSRHSSKPIPAILCFFPPFVKTHASRSVTTPCVSPYVTSHGRFLQFDGQVYWNSRLEKEHRRWGPLWPISRQYLANPISPRSHQPISPGDQFWKYVHSYLHPNRGGGGGGAHRGGVSNCFAHDLIGGGGSPSFCLAGSSTQ